MPFSSSREDAEPQGPRGEGWGTRVLLPPRAHLWASPGSGLNNADFGSGTKAKFAFALGGAAPLAPASFLRPGHLADGKHWVVWPKIGHFFLFKRQTQKHTGHGGVPCVLLPSPKLGVLSLTSRTGFCPGSAVAGPPSCSPILPPRESLKTVLMGNEMSVDGADGADPGSSYSTVTREHLAPK